VISLAAQEKSHIILPFINRLYLGRIVALMNLANIEPGEVLLYFGIFILIGLTLALLLLGWVFWRIRKIHLPYNADFFTALRHTPLSVVILLDLLDLTLDFLAAPFSWVLLGKLGLAPLRGVTVIESLIPGTQMLPTMTIAWVVARVWKNAPRIPTQFPY
jgi:hypothetical protein